MQSGGVLERVTVYRNGALVERRVDVEAAGAVEVTGLPLLLVSDTLRARTDDIEVRELEERAHLSRESAGGADPEETIRALELTLESSERSLARVDDARRVLQAIRPHLPDERASGEQRVPDPTLWLDAHVTVAERMATLDDERTRLLREIKTRRDELRRLTMRGQEELAPPVYSRAVHFHASGPGRVTLEYFVPAARWVPSYELHLEDEAVRLTLAALIAQATGEDWSGAQMCFSTANLSRSSVLPELDGWRLGRRQANRAPRFRPLPPGLEALFDAYDRGRLRPMPSAGPGGGDEPPGDGGFEFDETTGALALEDDLDDEEESGSEADLGMAEDGLPAPMEMSIQAAPAQAAPAAPGGFLERSEVAYEPEFRTRSSGFSFGGGAPKAKKRAKGRADKEMAPEPAPEPLPPRFRHAYLRLDGPEDDRRGQLREIAALEHLYQLLEDHEAAHESDLHRAMQALQRAADRLQTLELPAGTTPLDACDFHFVYTAPGQHDVPSDGVFHRLQVTDFDSSATIDFRCVPREAPEVYRHVVLEAPRGVPLPTGPLHVFESGAFVITSTLPGTGGGTAVEVNLGVEDRLVLDGRDAKIHQSEKGLVSSRSEVLHKVDTRFKSTLANAATLWVYDRVPVVASEVEKDLSVEVKDLSPEPARRGRGPFGKPLEGGLAWRLEVLPGKSAVLAFSYVVELPAKSEVIGGNRRE